MNNRAVCEALRNYFIEQSIIINVNYDSVYLTIEAFLSYNIQHPLYNTDQLQETIKNVKTIILNDLQETFGLYCHDINITNTTELDCVNSISHYGVFLPHTKAEVHRICIRFDYYLEQKQMDLLYALFRIKGLI